MGWINLWHFTINYSCRLSWCKWKVWHIILKVIIPMNSVSVTLSFVKENICWKNLYSYQYKSECFKQILYNVTRRFVDLLFVFVLSFTWRQNVSHNIFFSGVLFFWIFLQKTITWKGHKNIDITLLDRQLSCFVFKTFLKFYSHVYINLIKHRMQGVRNIWLMYVFVEVSYLEAI